MDVHVKRTHDKAIYLKEDRYENPKEMFKVLAARAVASGALKKGSVVADIGCATGEFLYYLRSCFSDAEYHGYDVVPELLEKAERKVPGVAFHLGSVLDRKALAPASVDVAFLIGVMRIFDEFEPCLDNLLHWARPGGRIYVAGLFNPYPIDVWVKYRLSDDADPNHREPGWNMFSIASVSRYLDSCVGAGRYLFTPFELPFDLDPHAGDPVRTWTFRDSCGRRLFTNGLSLLCHIEILEISP